MIALWLLGSLGFVAFGVLMLWWSHQTWRFEIPLMVSGIMALMAALLWFCIGGGLLADQASCSARWSGVYATDWGLLSGCRVSIGGRLVPDDVYRVFEPLKAS